MFRLPSAAALKALEAAARHSNFSKAAEEMHVTQSAVSHQIRGLEEFWGLELFQRQQHGVCLTPAGRALASDVGEFLAKINATYAALQAESVSGPLRISMLESFAVRWLVPRLGRFRAIQPKSNVWISTRDEFVDFFGADSDVDLAVRLGYGDYPKLFSKFLLRDHVFPVCSPEFQRQTEPLSSPEDMLPYLLLNRPGESFVPTWTDWYRAAEIDGVVEETGPHFHDTHMALQAAIEGQGIALARSSLVHADLKARRLIRPLGLSCPSPIGYFLVCPSGREKLPKIALFMEWICAEAEIAQREYDTEIGESASRGSREFD